MLLKAFSIILIISFGVTISPAFGAATFTSSNPTEDGHIEDDNNDDLCNESGTYDQLTGLSILSVGTWAISTAQDCNRAYIEYDISSVPKDAIISGATLTYEVASLNSVGPGVCDFYGMLTQPTTRTAAQIFDEINDGTLLVDDDAGCNTVGVSKSVALGATGATYLQNQLAQGWAAFGILADDEIMQPAVNEISQIASEEDGGATPAPTLTFFWYEPTNIEVSQTIGNVGDVFRINGTVSILEGTPTVNITQILIRVNGTLFNTNATDHNGTAPYSVKYGPLWYFEALDTPRNITATVTTQRNFTTTENETKSYVTREYAPDYFTAIIPSQGDVNFTKPDTGGIKVNRDKSGATFQIECSCTTYAEAFLNISGSTWRNETVVGYHDYRCPAGTALTACYNDDLLFITSYPANSSTILVSGTAIFDQLGGFLGAPAALLVVLAIYSLGTGRNFPIISVVAMSALGVMGALGLMVLSGEIWALIMVITGLSIFGVRKFF